MNVMSMDVKTDGDRRGSWRLHVIGDLHLDAKTTDIKRVKDHIAFIAADPSCMYVVVGDLVDGTVPGHRFFAPSTIRSEVLQEMGRYVDFMVEELIELFRPLEGKPGLFIQGNHDIRKGIDYSGIVGRVARETGARYGGDECMVRIMAPRPDGRSPQAWKLYAHHGAGGGITPGAKITRVQNTIGVLADADLYVRGHVHDGDCRIIEKVSVSSTGAVRMTLRSRAFLTAPAYAPARTEGVCGYAGQKGLPPQDNGIMFLHCHNGRAGKYPMKIFREEWRG